jgi:uncharacterized protein (DUF1330 family)
MIDWTDDALDRLAREDDGRPFVMINLLNFKPDGGWDTYQEFAKRNSHIWDKYGAEVVYIGSGCPPLIADEGQGWDGVFLAQYPSRTAFVEMVRDPEYLETAHLRTEALVESVLQPSNPTARWAHQPVPEPAKG